MEGKNPNCAYGRWDCMPCTNCNAYIPTKTNADRIQSMSNEELRNLLKTVAFEESPWDKPFIREYCDKCEPITGTLVESGHEVTLYECDFNDGKCPPRRCHHVVA